MKSTPPKDANSKALQLQREKHRSHQKKFERRMSYGALVVLVIVVAAFVAWPVLSNGAGSNDGLSLGSYRGKPIQYSARYGLFNNNLNRLLDQFGMDNSSAQLRNIFERAFFSTVSQYGRYFFLRDRGNEVSSREANGLIYQQLTQDGKLNRSAWNDLQNDPNRLKDTQDLMIYAAAQDIWNDVYNSTDLVRGKELELLVPTLGDLRRVSYLYYTVADFPESEVETFYDKNNRLFEKAFLRRIVVDSANRKKVESELADSGNFGELAQLYSQDVYSQSKGEYGYQFSYELNRFFADFEDITEEQAKEWTDKVFSLKQGEYAGPYELNKQWYFFQIKTEAEIEAEKEAEKVAADEDAAGNEQAITEEPAGELSGFASVAPIVRSYIERNELSLITDYFRKELETLRVRAKSADSLLGLEQDDRAVRADYGSSSEYFGFAYAGENAGAIYDLLSDAFDEKDLAALLQGSKQFFEDIFALKPGELSDVMLFGTEAAGSDTEQQYIVLFRLEEFRQSNVNDFVRSPGDDLTSRKSLFNYYLSSILSSGMELGFLQSRNLKQHFDSAYNSWSSRQVRN